jgi:hypothetical protein
MTQATPFYLVAFNRIRGIESALDIVARSTIPLELIILDMGSTWGRYWDFIKTSKVRVIEIPGGIGPRDLWRTRIIETLGTDGFFLSDGDIDYSATSDGAFERMRDLSKRYPWFPKVGLALDLDVIPDDLEGRRVRSWAKNDWRVQIEKNIYVSNVDTTIAYYPTRDCTFYFRPGLRIAGEFTCNHYPWQERMGSLTEEARFYWNLANSRISSTAEALWPESKFIVKQFLYIKLLALAKHLLKYEITAKLLVRMLALNGKIEPTTKPLIV